MIYESGDTIRAVATFRNWAPEGTTGTAVDPTNVSVTVYDADQTVIKTYALGTDLEVTKPDATTGVYYFDFIIPSAGTFYIEFKGELDGEPTLIREKIKAKFNV